ncbi:MAG: hypothetical protein ABFD60_01735 [Bryobacteraceae bacterium]
MSWLTNTITVSLPVWQWVLEIMAAGLGFTLGGVIYRRLFRRR